MEQNNKEIALNVLFVPHNKKEKRQKFYYKKQNRHIHQNITTSVKTSYFVNDY